MKSLVSIFAIFLFFISTNVIACSFNADCDIGSKCVKKVGELEGYCAGGLNPGNSNDNNPYRDSMDMTGKKGNTCSFDLDCGVGGRCIKGNGIYGTCM